MLVWNYIKKHKKVLILALVLATINQVFSLLDPQIFRLIIDNYASKANTLPKDVFINGVLLLLLASIGVALVSRTAEKLKMLKKALSKKQHIWLEAQQKL